MDKSHILNEIKRTAKANGGAPLGMNRFETETGIKQYDWNRFWPRWSDALREAGFAPNQFNEAYDKATLMDKYAKLAQYLGRIPTDRDLLLKARDDPTFPFPKTFKARLGAKPELIALLIEHCRSRSEYEDVIRLCEAYVPRHRDESSESEIAETEVGFVYLIKSGRFYKIGKTNAVGRREYELALQLPERATTVHVIRTDDPGGIEAFWHNRFKERRKNGEWFELDSADIAAFRRRKFM